MKLHHAKIGLALSSAILLSGVLTASAFAQGETDVPSVKTQNPDFETVLPGFQGVKWGDSMTTANEKMGILKTFKFSSELSNKETLFYTGGELGGQKIGLLGLSFTDEGFARAMLFFEGDENKILSQYKEIQDLLIQKYGKPSKAARLFVPPYEEGDGYEKQAIRLGKAKIVSLWYFKEPGKPESEQNGLLLDIKDSLLIGLTYENSPRWDRWMDKKRAEKSKDF